MTIVALAICFCFAAFGAISVFGLTSGAKSKQVARAIVAVVGLIGLCATLGLLAYFAPLIIVAAIYTAPGVVALAASHFVSDFARQRMPTWVLLAPFALSAAILGAAICAYAINPSEKNVLLYWTMLGAAYSLTFTVAPLGFLAATNSDDTRSVLVWNGLLLLSLTPIIGTVVLVASISLKSAMGLLPPGWP